MANSDVELRAVATLPEENPSPVLRLASDGTISYSNPAGKAILQAWDCKVGGQAPQVWRETVKEVLAKNASRVIELEYGPVVYSFSVVPIPEQGHVNLYVNDVTVREMTLKALRESEEKYRELVEKATCIILKTDFAGRIVSFNEYAKVFFGCDPEELLGKSVVATIAPRLESTGRDLTKLMADVVAHPEQYRTNISGNVKKRGERVWIQWNNSVVADGQGRPTGVICIGTDVTESVRAEEALRESEERFRSMFESSGVGIGIATPNGHILVANPVLISTLGYSEAESYGTTVQEHVHPDDRERVIAAMEKMLTTGGPNCRFEARFCHRDGHYIWMSQTASFVRDAAGNPLYMIAILEDITLRKEAEEALRESEETFRSVMENAPIGMNVTLPDGRWVKVNRALAEMLGYSVSELVGKSFYDYLHPDDVKQIEKARGPLIEGSADWYSVEARWVRSDRRIAISETNVSVVRDPAGKPLFTISQIQDITKRKDAEEALRESESKFRTSFQSAATGMVIMGTDNRFIKVNRALCTILGYSEEELVGKDVLEITFPEDRPKIEDVKGKLVGGEMQEVHFEKRYLHKDGHAVWGNVSSAPVRGPDGQVQYFITQIEDITTRKTAEEALKNGERRFRELVEGASAGIWTIDPQGRTTYTNRRMAEMLGCEVEEMMGRSFFDFMDEVGTQKAKALMKRREEGISETHEFEFIKKDGSRIYVTLSTNPVLDFSGRYTGAEAVVTDITARKLAEEELGMYSKRLENLVEIRTAELEETHRVLLETEGLAAIGRVSTQLAHDLRNPLAGIMTEAYVLGELLPKSLDPRARDTLRLLSDSVIHAGKVIEDLLEYTRVQEPRRQPLELGACIADVVAAFPIPKAVSLVVKKTPKVHVLAENAQMAKVVRSLLYNAVEAMPHGGRLIVSFELKGGFVSFSVADTGVGIDKADLLKVFLPFYSTKAKGLGLGLNIARRIVEANGGSMELKSTKEKGTKVTVMLPIASETPG